ncbi:MAG: FKBP-type peptidyl-prolyl cis-trans isomerase [Actinomycetes bacterium]
MKKPLLAATAVVLILSVAACGKQTDDRVSGSSAPAASAPAASAPAASAPAASAPAASAPAASANPSAVQSSLAALAPFVTVDCTSGQVSPTDQPSPNGTTIGSVTGVIQPNGAPAITVATDAVPATELGVADMTEGSGAAVKAGDTLTVNYCGVGLGGKALFDSSYSRGTPATFPLDGVIAGWQQGLVGMKEGGTRLLVIPGALAYGANPPGGSGIQPDETLIFIVELAKIG